MWYKRSFGEWLFDGFNIAFMLLLMVIMLFPLWHVLVVSLSSPSQIALRGATMIWPGGFNLEVYRLVFTNPMILTGFRNTLIIVFFGTSFGILATLTSAYALSRKWLAARKYFMWFIVVPMFFSGGLIPSFLLNRSLGLFDNRLVLILPGIYVTWYIIMMRAYFFTIPESLEESARMDGANDFQILFRVIAPIATPIIAVIVLFYAVSFWNAWFGASIYLRDRNLFPIQLVLRNILVSGNMRDIDTGYLTGANRVEVFKGIRYATIMVATVPILCVYPFLQRYFVKGIMIGSIKG